MNETRQARAEYIRRNYALERLSDGSWRATGTGYKPILGSDRDDVCRNARRRMGHFNFNDEALAFAEIFGPERK